MKWRVPQCRTGWRASFNVRGSMGFKLGLHQPWLSGPLISCTVSLWVFVEFCAAPAKPTGLSTLWRVSTPSPLPPAISGTLVCRLYLEGGGRQCVWIKVFTVLFVAVLGVVYSSGPTLGFLKQCFSIVIGDWAVDGNFSHWGTLACFSYFKSAVFIFHSIVPYLWMI